MSVKSHFKIILTAGMGFFTDAYDLFVIGIVTTLLVPIWHLTTGQLALLNGAALIAAACGSVIFGALADKYGRKKMYGIEIIILIIGALFAACSNSFEQLLVARIIVGLGIGGDYPTSAVVASEHAHESRRGYVVLMVFAMQALGLIVGPLLASLLLATNVDPHIIWRSLLAFGAIPAATVFYLRRQIAETPAFLLQKEHYEVSRLTAELAGVVEVVKPVKSAGLLNMPWIKFLIATAGCWFLLDVIFYGNSISSLMILNKVDPQNDLLSRTVIAACLFLVFAFPGYLLAAHYVDRIGRKRLQVLGFMGIALCYFAICFIPGVLKDLPLFTLLFGLSFFFVNFGPNTTTFLIPAECFPTQLRAKGHGISAAIGKVGAFIGAFYLPFLLKATSMSIILGLLGGLSVLGALLTSLLTDHTNKKLG